MLSLPLLSLVLVAGFAGGETGLSPRVAAGLESVLKSPHLTDARVAVAVVDLASGELLFERAIDEAFAPASNMKLLTTAAALATLGADHEFTTSFVAAAEPEAGRLQGDLFVVGTGDPSLRADVLDPSAATDPAVLLSQLVRGAGLVSVAGDLVLDAGAFVDEGVHADWEAADLDRAFAAPIGALSIDGNRIEVRIDGRGPTATLSTPLSGYRVDNELRSSSTRGTWQVGAIRPDASGDLRVFGAISRDVTDRLLEVPVREPPRLFGERLLAAFANAGIEVDGGIRLAPGASRHLESSVELARLATPISRAVLLANKESDNSMADHLFKAIGTSVASTGSFATGGEGVLTFLRDTVGTRVQGVEVRDGSGLSARNRVTARAVVSTLVHMAATPGAERDVFLRSLPVGGVDGTLRTRMAAASTRGAVRAKTGFITGVSTLSGYVRSRGGRVFAFSILFNGIKPGTNAKLKHVQDEVCRVLAELD